MDYESSNDEKHNEDFQINKESWFPLSPNPMDYESNSDEEKGTFKGLIFAGELIFHVFLYKTIRQFPIFFFLKMICPNFVV